MLTVARNHFTLHNVLRASKELLRECRLLLWRRLLLLLLVLLLVVVLLRVLKLLVLVLKLLGPRVLLVERL